ncbi:SixA phosphatase family protein [Thalassotalea atypica]|uniref:SixA phosphatase family protein n=1 Tax=Thalassotalea atypica TaxID=2054316 RepID=UPI002573F317|nr:histidine phosphatase family protein [Thalassotalea atypica]
MKNIHLIRHAKSSWENATLTDHQRPLNKRGRKACERMAPRIWSHGCSFKNVYASTAIRAQQTIELISQQLQLNMHWRSDSLLYTFDSNELYHWLVQRPEDEESVVIIGHNPALMSLSNLLGDQELAHLPTCSYVHLAANVQHWNALDNHCANIQAFYHPKMFIDEW